MTQEKLDNQRDVVKNEKKERYDNQPYGDWSERLQAMVFPPDHPYHHTVIGSMEDLDAATLGDVERFFQTYYVPRNAVLTVAGDIDPAATLELVDRYFGEIPPGAPPPPLPGRPGLEAKLGRTLREEVTAEVPLPRVIMAFRTPPYSSNEFAVAEVSRALLGMGRASRLYRRLVRERFTWPAIARKTVAAYREMIAEIGKELHDNVNQILSTAKLYLELARTEEDERLDLINRSTDNISNAINEIRSISRSLVPPSVGDLGLIDHHSRVCRNTGLHQYDLGI